jgi:hypothetical protein
MLPQERAHYFVRLARTHGLANVEV